MLYVRLLSSGSPLKAREEVNNFLSLRIYSTPRLHQPDVSPVGALARLNT